MARDMQRKREYDREYRKGRRSEPGYVNPWKRKDGTQSDTHFFLPFLRDDDGSPITVEREPTYNRPTSRSIVCPCGRPALGVARRNKRHGYCERCSIRIHGPFQKYASRGLSDEDAYLWFEHSGPPFPPREMRRRKMLADYGMTEDTVTAIKASQGYLCAICNCSPYEQGLEWRIDRDVRSGRVRGMVCGYCFPLIGAVRARPSHAPDRGREIYRQIREYLAQRATYDARRVEVPDWQEVLTGSLPVKDYFDGCSDHFPIPEPKCAACKAV